VRCYSQCSSWRCRRRASFSTLQRLNHLDLTIGALSYFQIFCWRNAIVILIERRKKIEENRSRCLDDLKKGPKKTDSSTISESRFEIQRFKILYYNQVGLWLNFQLSLIWDFRISMFIYILRRSYIVFLFSSSCLLFSNHNVIFFLARLWPS